MSLTHSTTYRLYQHTNRDTATETIPTLFAAASTSWQTILTGVETAQIARPCGTNRIAAVSTTEAHETGETTIMVDIGMIGSVTATIASDLDRGRP